MASRLLPLVLFLSSCDALKVGGVENIRVGLLQSVPGPRTELKRPTAARPNRPTVPEPEHAEPSTVRMPPAKMQVDVQEVETTFDDLLDAPLIDPFSPSSTPLMVWFKALVREDYIAAEAIWAGVYCSICVTVGMQLVHAYLESQPIVESCAVVYCQSPSF